MTADQHTTRRAVMAADVVNAAIDGSLDVDWLVRTLRSWSARVDRDGPDPVDVGAADLDAVVALAERMRAVFAATDPVHTIDGLLRGLRIAPSIVRHDGDDAHVHFDAPDASAAERMEVNLVLGLATFVCEDPTRVGSCDAEGCERVHVDTSRNGRRRFCSRPCANRSHVAAHRARRAAS